ncbi:MAG: class I SAM-dependent methyltransferase [Myxococcota bacterium]
MDQESQAPSRTALLVQQALLYCATRLSTAHLVPDEARATILEVLRNLPEGRQAIQELSQRRWLVKAKEWALLPGATVHHAVRKRWMEQEVERAIANGATQLLVLGAGLDTLGLRLVRRHPSLRVGEVDHPASHKQKQQAVGAESGLHLMACDFSHQRLTEVVGPPFDPATPTVVVCEGVLPYLSRTETAALFEDLGGFESVTLLFTFLARHSPTGRMPYGPFMRLFAAFKGEPMRMQMSPDEMKEFVSEMGWTLEEVTHTPALLASTLPAPSYQGPIHDLEAFARAVR